MTHPNQRGQLRSARLGEFYAKEGHVEKLLGDGFEEIQPFSTPAEAAFAGLERITDHLRREIQLILRDRGVTPAQFYVLRALHRDSCGLTCSALSSRLAGTDPDITRLLDRLVTQGLVRRQRDARDRRAVLAEITEEGRRLLKSIAPSVDARIHNLFQHMKEERLKLLIDLLDEARGSESEREEMPQRFPAARAG